MRFTAQYFNGVGATATTVAVTLTDNSLSFVLNDTPLIFSAREFRIQPLLGKSRRVIELDNGGRLEADQVLSLPAGHEKAGGVWQLIHKLENKLVYIAGAIVFTIAFFWMVSFYAIPALAKQIALALPVESEAALGRSVLNSLDFEHKILQPSALPLSRQAAIESHLSQLCRVQQSCPRYTLVFRQSAMLGANAIALPGGIIVITDGLVALARDEAEINAVLSHELGHLALRHTMRQVLQSTLSGLLMVAVIGDIESLASAVPAALMQGRYSREMENEADTFAVKALQAAGVESAVLANILERLDGQSGGNVNNVFSTHPDTASRIQRLRTAQDPAPR